MRKKIVAGNWKMNKDINESARLIEEIKDSIKRIEINNVDVIICPPFLSIPFASQLLKGTDIKIGGQNLHHKDDGAYTGEISARMLRQAGCEFVILGHSERRQYFNETNAIINLKILKALEYDLKPILCVGETLQERENETHFKIVDSQVTQCLKGISDVLIDNIIIAYEPVWAIGTGKTATKEQAEEMHCEIRKSIENLYSKFIAEKLKIIYGGSVNEENAKSLFSMNNVDGGLIGGASLKSENFIKIIESAINI